MHQVSLVSLAIVVVFGMIAAPIKAYGIARVSGFAAPPERYVPGRAIVILGCYGILTLCVTLVMVALAKTI